MDSILRSEEVILPNRLTALVTLALEEAKKLDRELYNPASWTWHDPSFDGIPCRVCLAGCLIAGPLRGDAGRSMQLCYFDLEIRMKLLAVESFRKGHFGGALLRTLQIDGSTDDPYSESAVKVDRKIDEMDEEQYSVLMNTYSEFVNWNQFDAFTLYAKRVVGLLERMGY